MKILHAVQDYYPIPGGMQEVVKQLSERLAAMGHEVTVATRKRSERDFSVRNNVKIREFEIDGNLAGEVSGETEAYRNFLLTEKFDVITFFAAQQFASDLALDILPQIYGKKVSVPTGYSGLFQDKYKDYYSNMKSWIHDYDMNVFLSEDYRDINFAKENGVDKITIIPNGADEREFESASATDVRKTFGIPADHKLILHVGSYTGRKGHKEAIEIFLSSDLSNCALLMIGDNVEYFKNKTILKYPSLLLKWNMSKLGSKKIIMQSCDRKTTVDAFKQADLFFFPSQIECSPIVLFEAAAAGVPFLSSSAGNSAEIAEWTKGGMILPGKKDAEGFWEADINGGAKLLSEFLRNESARKKTGSDGKKNWKEKFTWQKIAEQYNNLYKNLTGK